MMDHQAASCIIRMGGRSLLLSSLANSNPAVVFRSSSVLLHRLRHYRADNAVFPHYFAPSSNANRTPKKAPLERSDQQLTTNLDNNKKNLATLTKAIGIRSLLSRRPAAAAAASNRLLCAPWLVRGFGTSSSSSMHMNPKSFMEKEAATGGIEEAEKWLVVIAKVPEGKVALDDIINSHVKTLSKVVGSEEEEEMRRKIEMLYKQDPHALVPYGFMANVPKDVSTKMKDLGQLRLAVPNGSDLKVQLQPILVDSARDHESLEERRKKRKKN